MKLLNRVTDYVKLAVGKVNTRAALLTPKDSVNDVCFKGVRLRLPNDFKEQRVQTSIHVRARIFDRPTSGGGVCRLAVCVEPAQGADRLLIESEDQALKLAAERVATGLRRMMPDCVFSAAEIVRVGGLDAAMVAWSANADKCLGRVGCVVVAATNRSVVTFLIQSDSSRDRHELLSALHAVEGTTFSAEGHLG
jgi:hypothetical protein